MRLLVNSKSVMCLSVVLALGLASVVSAATDADWFDAKSIQYNIVGVFDGRVGLGGDGYVHVTDRVEVDLTTDPSLVLQGKITIRNFPSVVSDPQPVAPGCRVPELAGPFEFYTLQSVESLAEDQMMVAGAHSVRDYPSMVVQAGCVGKRSVAAHQTQDDDEFSVPGVGQFLMDPAQVNSATVKLDKQSRTLTVRNGDWTWTYHATPL